MITKIVRPAIYIVLSVATVVTLLPVWWVLQASFVVGSSAFSSSIIPSKITFENYLALLHTEFFRWALNSIIVSVASGIISVIVTALAAYAFARMQFPGRRYGIISLFILQMFPASMYIPAIYTLLTELHLEGTLVGLILVYSGAQAFYIWLMRAYIATIPKDIDEAALVDGANRWQVFWKIILPLSRPMLVTLFIWSLMTSYNDFMTASVVLQGDPSIYTVAVGLRSLIVNQFATNWTLFAAGAVIASFPVMIIYLMLQKQLMSGLTRGAVK